MRKNCRFLAFFVFLFVALSFLMAQERAVTGVVTDSEGETLPGVSVVVKGTTQGTVTDIDGKFAMSMPRQATLVFSYVGFQSREIEVADQEYIDVILDISSIELEEIVAIGYGTQTRTTVTVATSTVKGDVLEDVPTTTVSSRLQGRLAGVAIRANSAQPGRELEIRIRGGSSINKSNSPLVLIDGFQRSMSDISSNDIESIDVLKDAAATAIYGSRASNGVILITTKRGKVADTRMDFRVTYGIQEFNRQYELLSAKQYLQWWRPRIAISRYGYSEGWIDGSQPTGTGNNYTSTWTPRFLAEGEPVPAGWQSMVDPITGEIIVFQDTNLQDILFQTALHRDYNLSATGGNDKIKFATGFGYTNQEGVAIGTKYERMSGRVNLDFQVTENFDIGVNSDFSYSTANSFTDESNIFTRGVMNAPTLRERFEDGTPGWGTNGTLANPQWVIDTRDVTDKRYIANFGVNAQWEIVKGLVISGNTFYFAQLGTYDYFEKAHEFSQLRNAKADRDVLTRRQSEVLLKYAKIFNEKHNFDFLLGCTDLYLKTDNAALSANGGASDKIPTLNVAPTKLDASTSISDERLISHFGRINYNYNLKYLFSASLRRDGSSKFGRGNRFGYFPSASAGWVVSNEDFFSSGNIFEFVKLRASYGVTGNNDIGRYVSQGVYQAGYSYGGNAATSATAMPNTALSWEKTHQTDIGIELGLFDRRKLEITADLYRRRTDDLLFTVQLPRESGFNSVEQNVGSVEYRGFELSISSRNITRSTFSWTTQFNYAYNINEVLKLPYREGIDKNRINGTILPDGSGFGGIAEGERMGSIVGYKVNFIIDNEEQAAKALYDESANGYDPKTGKLIGRGTKFPGDVEWVDRDGDGKITSLDRFVLGYVHPTVTGGITNNLSFG